MIDFRKAIVRVTKFTVKEGDFYLKDVSSAEVKKFSEEAGFTDDADGDVEQFMFLFFQNMLCDEKGELLGLSQDELEALPRSLIKEITEKIQELALGQKKS